MKTETKIKIAWITIIVIIILIISFIITNDHIINTKVILIDMDFVAQTTFTVYKSLGYGKLIPTTSKDLGPIEVSKGEFIYPEYSRTVTITKLSNKEARQIDLIVSRSKHKKKFTEIIAKNEK